MPKSRGKGEKQRSPKSSKKKVVPSHGFKSAGESPAKPDNSGGGLKDEPFETYRRKVRRALERSADAGHTTLRAEDLPRPPGYEGEWPPKMAHAEELAALYLRVSTAEQFGSVPQQADELLVELYERGIFVAAIYWDESTGRNYRRKGLRTLLKDSRTAPFSASYVWHVNRAGRDDILGPLILKALHDRGTPLWYGNGRGRFEIADMDDARSRRNVVDELNRAADDLDEHHARTTRHIPPTLDDGCWPGAPFEPLFYRLLEEQTRRDVRRVILPRDDAAAMVANALAALRESPTRAAAERLARALGVKLAKLRTSLESSWLKGELNYGSHPHVPHHEHLRLLSDDDWDELQKLVAQAFAVTRARVRPSALDTAVDHSSPAHLYKLTDGKLAPWCDECGSKMALKNPSSPHNHGADLWVCTQNPEQHRECHPRLPVRDALRHGKLPRCDTCGAIMEYQDAVRKEGQWWSDKVCPDCGRIDRSNHEQNPRRIREQEAWGSHLPLPERRKARRQGAKQPDHQKTMGGFFGSDEDGEGAAAAP